MGKAGQECLAVHGLPGRRSYGIIVLGRTKAGISFCFFLGLAQESGIPLSGPEIQQQCFWCKKSWIHGILNENICISTLLVLIFLKNSLEFLDISNF